MSNSLRCEIDDARLFLQVIGDSRKPLGILREALSNSYDAGASRVKLVLSREPDDATTVRVDDNGNGIEPEEFRYFFGLGFGNKEGSGSIGSKGLGTKLYFNSERIDVYTRLATGKGYHAVLDSPLLQLASGQPPRYTLYRSECHDLPFAKGTSIRIRGLRASRRSSLLASEAAANYLRWFTVAGSCRQLFGLRGSRRFVVDLHQHGPPAARVRIAGHELPHQPFTPKTTYASFAKTFDPFSFSLENDAGEPVGELEVAGSIVGPEGHLVKDRRVKKRFKGLFLAKDYFIVRDANGEVFGGTGEWQNTHIVANCQDFRLSMSRDDFVETGSGSTYSEAISALRSFVNALRRGEPFRYRGQTVETGPNTAGACYMIMRGLREREATVLGDGLKVLDLLTASSVLKTSEYNDGGPLLAPIDPVGVLLAFQSLVAKRHRFSLMNQPRELVRFRVLGYFGGSRNLLLVQKHEGTGWGKPLFYKACVELGQLPPKELSGADGILCWNLGERQRELSPKLDVVVLGGKVSD